MGALKSCPSGRIRNTSTLTFFIIINFLHRKLGIIFLKIDIPNIDIHSILTLRLEFLPPP